MKSKKTGLEFKVLLWMSLPYLFLLHLPSMYSKLSPSSMPQQPFCFHTSFFSLPFYSSFHSFCLNYLFKILLPFSHLCLINSVQMLMTLQSFLDSLSKLCPLSLYLRHCVHSSYDTNHLALLIGASPSLPWNIQLLMFIYHTSISTHF